VDLFTTMHGMCFVPKSDFYVLDDWYVSGLRGTGSKSVVVDDAWVPPHRFVSLEQMRNGTTPGAEIYPDSPYYRAPFHLVVNQLLLAAAIGMARGVLDAFEERVTKRFDIHTGKPASEGAGAQIRFAESEAEVGAAIMYIHKNCDMLEAWGRSGHVPDVRERAEIRRNVAYATRMAVPTASASAASPATAPWRACRPI
jgi:alkylation response protein AidB-like acyl-CoA dehydrogenase